MVGMILKDGKCAINLFHQHYARQLVRQRHLAQRQRESGKAPRFFTEAIAIPNGEEQRGCIQLLALQKSRKLFG